MITEEIRTCKKCNKRYVISKFPTVTTKEGTYHRHECKYCKAQGQVGYYANRTEEQIERNRLRARETEQLNWNKEREWNDVEFKFCLRKARYLKKSKEYLRTVPFTPGEMVSEAHILLGERKLPYSRKQFYLLMWNAMARFKYDRIKTNPGAYADLVKRQREWKAEQRRILSDWYVKHLLSKEHTTDYINENPYLITEKREQLIQFREDKEKQDDLPDLPDTWTWLSDLPGFEDYLGYAVTRNGEFYSCKANVLSAKNYGEFKKVKPKKGELTIRLSNNGVKQGFSINKIMNLIKYSRFHSI